MVKVLALEGNKIKLSRKAILKEQREKLKGQGAPVSGDGNEGEPEGEPVASERPPRERREGRPPRERRERR